MKLSKLIGNRIKENPKDAICPSHIFLIRGGYARPVSSGLYTILPLGRRITLKIEKILREEMNRINGQENLMPLVQPRELWKESGRDQKIDSTLMRMVDRNNKEMVLAMTHEETTCHMIRTEISSYKQMPSMAYQIQTKYRGEARPRAGLIRVREFTMKDGYSFHESEECLKEYYKSAHEAYVRIFRRIGMNDVLSIEGDSGMMGGSISHEFMAICEVGEDTILVSPDRRYRANQDIAIAKYELDQSEALPLEKIATPNMKTIAEVSDFLNITKKQTGKAVFFASESLGIIIFAVIRGDLDLNEVKLMNYLGTMDLLPATDEEIESIGCIAGYASTIGVKADNLRIIIDPTIAGSANLTVGANEKDYHYKNFNYERDNDQKCEIVDIATAKSGDICSLTGESLETLNGIEVGNIFQLGTRYSESMGCTFLDRNGKSKPIVMGCYGIGVERAMASIIEQNYDKYGPIWPLAIAPFHLHIIALNPNKENVREIAENLYENLLQQGIEVIYDDRGEKAGFAFNDADLMGIPFRAVISPKSLENGGIEFKARDNSFKEIISMDDASQIINNRIKKALDDLES